MKSWRERGTSESRELRVWLKYGENREALRRLGRGQIMAVQEILTSSLRNLGFFLKATERSLQVPEPCRNKVDWYSGEIILEANVEN